MSMYPLVEVGIVYFAGYNEIRYLFQFVPIEMPIVGSNHKNSSTEILKRLDDVIFRVLVLSSRINKYPL